VVAHAGGVDWVLSQVTSNRYGDKSAVELGDAEFGSGGLPRVSYVRPGKLFTASDTIVVRVAVQLSGPAHRRVVEAITQLLTRGLP
jgi:mRNA interferase MazF